jgi:16S rRNA G527 N7-methylase RsmG
MRAVAPLGDCLRWGRLIAAKDARLIVFKGPQWQRELAEATPAIKKHGWRFESCTQIPWAAPKLLVFSRAPV